MVVGYGKKVREKVRKVEITKKRKYKCPTCSRRTIKRKSMGVWECRKCKAKFASGSYEFKR
ncbi:hypothetical protein ACFLQN_01220 [Candidatus Aenigmatarchaeota archaeon]